MRRRQKQGPQAEMPARLCEFRGADWIDPAWTPSSRDEEAKAQARAWDEWRAARREWCDENGVDLLSVLRREHADRLDRLRRSARHGAEQDDDERGK